MRRTAWIKRPRKRRPRELRGPELDYGSDWDAQAAKARKVDRHCCQICGRKNGRGEPRLAVHHLVALRICQKLGCEGHSLVNLLPVCGRCHAAVLGGESKLIAGDVVGAWADYRAAGVPLDRLAEAFRHVGLPTVRR